MIDAREVEARTGWRVLAMRVADSTNDEILRRAEAGTGHRVVLVADRQTAGRGRGGHRFASPVGGLYASLLLRVRPEDLPAGVVAATAVALAEALEARGGAGAQIKWPNDVRLRGRKVAGILAEARGGGAGPADGRVPVVVGVGCNLAGVPQDLPPDVAARTTALDLESQTPTPREALLAALLPRVDAWCVRLADTAGRVALEVAYRSRLALRGRSVRFLAADGPRRGVLRDVSLDRGLLVEDAEGRARWWPAAHARELVEDEPEPRPAPGSEPGGTMPAPDAGERAPAPE